MEIVQGEQLFLKPDRLATLKPYYKSEKLPQYTTFKPNNWRFYYTYFVYERKKRDMKERANGRPIWNQIQNCSFTFIIPNYYVIIYLRELRTYMRIHTHVVIIILISMRDGGGVKNVKWRNFLLSKYTANKLIESKWSMIPELIKIKTTHIYKAYNNIINKIIIFMNYYFYWYLKSKKLWIVHYHLQAKHE